VRPREGGRGRYEPRRGREIDLVHMTQPAPGDRDAASDPDLVSGRAALEAGDRARTRPWGGGGRAACRQRGRREEAGAEAEGER
jgi:hypothetical protein